MDDAFPGFLGELIGRIDGPMRFRLYLQPLTAIVLAVRDGRRDARAGRPPYGWALLTRSAHRRSLLRDGRKSIARVFVLAWAMDLVYQLVVLQRLRPLQALCMAILLALLPYLLLRGPIDRLLSWRRRQRERSRPA